jgi:hypothetical protein
VVRWVVEDDVVAVDGWVEEGTGCGWKEGGAWRLLVSYCTLTAIARISASQQFPQNVSRIKEVNSPLASVPPSTPSLSC